MKNVNFRILFQRGFKKNKSSYFDLFFKRITLYFKMEKFLMDFKQPSKMPINRGFSEVIYFNFLLKLINDQTLYLFLMQNGNILKEAKNL